MRSLQWNSREIAETRKQLIDAKHVGDLENSCERCGLCALLLKQTAHFVSFNRERGFNDGNKLQLWKISCTSGDKVLCGRRGSKCSLRAVRFFDVYAGEHTRYNLDRSRNENRPAKYNRCDGISEALQEAKKAPVWVLRATQMHGGINARTCRGIWICRNNRRESHLCLTHV